MRTAFVKTLLELAETHDFWIVTGDLGYSVLDEFAERFPDRYLNAGVAEQNMTAVAAGIATSGQKVFTYSIANFPTMRALEQVRNDVCYHGLDVKVVAVGGGFAYGPQGYTHHGIEDLAIMRALPGMTVLAPADPVEARLLARELMDHKGPCYVRLGKAGESVIHSDDIEVEIGRAIEVRSGNEVTLMTTGAVLGLAIKAADQLAAQGVEARVLSIHTVQPLDLDAVAHAAAETQGIVTIEEHVTAGGLGSAVADVLAINGNSRMRKIAIGDPLRVSIGSQEFLRNHHGISSESIVASAVELLSTPTTH